MRRGYDLRPAARAEPWILESGPGPRIAQRLPMRCTAVLLIPLLFGCSQAIEGIQNRGDQRSLENLKEKLAPVFAHSESELERFIGKWTEGYESVGEPADRSLASFNPVPFRAERGECIVLGIRLDPDASFSDQAQYGLGFLLKDAHAGQVQASPGVYGPGGVANAGCAFATTSLAFDMGTFLVSRGTAKVEDLGRGGVKVQVYRKTLPEREIAEMEAKALGCAVCRQAYDRCLATGFGQTQCGDEADACVSELAGQMFKEECW